MACIWHMACIWQSVCVNACIWQRGIVCVCGGGGGLYIATEGQCRIHNTIQNEQHSHNTHKLGNTLQDKIYNSTCTDWLRWHSCLESRWGHKMTFCMKGKGCAHAHMQHMYTHTPIYTSITHSCSRHRGVQTGMHTSKFACRCVHMHTHTHMMYTHTDTGISTFRGSPVHDTLFSSY